MARWTSNGCATGKETGFSAAHPLEGSGPWRAQVFPQDMKVASG